MAKRLTCNLLLFIYEYDERTANLLRTEQPIQYIFCAKNDDVTTLHHLEIPIEAVEIEKYRRKGRT